MRRGAAKLSFGAFAGWAGAKSALPAALARRLVPGITHDSRDVPDGALFVAITSSRDDGNRYAASALSRGAAAALVRPDALAQVPARLHRRLLLTADPLSALQRAAARYRRQLGVRTIGITGSNGKTTTRAFFSHVLGSAMPVGGTRGNLNNHIGVPLSLLGLSGNERVAIIEMGANHPGEIAVLTRIARPDVAVITNVGYSHVGLFGSLAQTLRAKLEIAQGLSRSRGVLYVNGDDARLRRAARRLGVRVITFGTGAGCDVRARDVQVGPDHTTFTVGAQCYRLGMPGRHFVYAALPALAVGQACGMGCAALAAAVATMRPVTMRGGMAMRRGVRFILDCYNANPSSMQSALDLLRDTTPENRRVALLGDMRELGRYATMLHRQLGRRVARSGVRALVAVGEDSRHIAEGARAAGMPPRAVLALGGVEQAAAALRAVCRRGDTVLVKASRSLALEQVYEAF